MICVLSTLGIISIIILLTYFGSHSTYRKTNVIGCSIICILAGSALIIGPLSSSYSTYLNIKADYYGVIAQYGNAIDIYTDKAIINIDKISFTDFKYQGYQKEIADLIKDLRYKVVRYNAMYIKKKTMKKNLIFSWLIIPPDSGMRLLQMSKEADKGKTMLLIPTIGVGE